MMKYFIIPIIIVIVLAVAMFLLRRKHIQIISKLENEKLQIQHEPIFEEMTKVKQLNMTGETEEKFERWRREWTEVVDVLVPQIDSLLFDTEEMIDRFRFKKAASIEKEIDSHLASCDEKKNSILQELNELIGSEEKNRVEMETLKETYRETRKVVLAHQHSFGKAVVALEKELEYFQPAFDEYDDLTNNGNYLQAREHVIAASSKGDIVFPLVSTIPDLLNDLQVKLPQTIRELRSGVNEMQEDGYYLDHLKVTSSLVEIENEIAQMHDSIARLEVEPVQQRLVEIEQTIEEFYGALEEEVKERQFVEYAYEEIAQKVAEVQTVVKEVSDEAQFVQQSYRLDEKEAAIPKQAVTDIESASTQFDEMTQLGEEGETAFSVLAQMLRDIQEAITHIETEATGFKERMKSLRTDEIAVRERMESLARTLQLAERRLQKANLPGIPEDIEVRLEEADEQLYIVQNGLEEVPLNMALVEEYINKAENEIEESVDKINEMLENALLTEQIIQYGNRYRASHPHLHARLLEAEMAFRQYRYAKALEEAATAVEEAEPGAMKRIQELYHETQEQQIH